MIKQLALAASAATMALAPAAAEARHHSSVSTYIGYGTPYYGGYSGYGYSQPYYGSSYYGNGYGNYGYGYDQPYYGNSYSGSRYSNRYYGRRHHCGSGTTGLIIGGAAGALLGREVSRSGNRYSYHRNSGTTGAIIGGAIGALAGREVARSC